MKKFIITFIILLIFSGVIFYFGWVQIHIPPNSCAVIHTKTSGFDKNVTMHGKFSWRVEKIIPTNMTMYIFNIEPVYINLPEIKGSLPSADIYSSVIQGSPEFTYNLDLSVSFGVNIETLPTLVSEQGLKPDNIDAWYKEKSEIISGYIITYIKNNPETIYDSEYIQPLIDELIKESNLSNIVINNIYLDNVYFPDLDLYYAAKDIYHNLLEAREIRDMDAINEEKNNLLILEEYGELLTKYPILIKYIYLNQLSDEKIIDEIFKADLNELLNIEE